MSLRWRGRRGTRRVLVPALVVGFGLAQQVAQGTALLALIPIWVIGALTHLRMRTLRLAEAAAVGSCGALTVPVGAEIAAHVGALPLRVIFAAFLIATAGRSLAHTPLQKPDPAAGSRSAAGSQPGAEDSPRGPAPAPVPSAGEPQAPTSARVRRVAAQGKL
jgi:uncharacterized membrane protein YfcA